jgi:hypothetical protein
VFVCYFVAQNMELKTDHKFDLEAENQLIRKEYRSLLRALRKNISPQETEIDSRGF